MHSKSLLLFGLHVFETRFNVGLDFYHDYFFSCSFLYPVRHCLRQLAVLKIQILDKRRRWFNSSRVKFPFVKMSASWFLVSMYLIWIFGSRLILSNNKSSATLWVRDTCLIVGLLPLIIILITASLSSKNCKARRNNEKSSRSRKHNRHWIHCGEFEY